MNICHSIMFIIITGNLAGYFHTYDSFNINGNCRKLNIFIPIDYEECNDYYPVIYMQDGWLIYFIIIIIYLLLSIIIIVDYYYLLLLYIININYYLILYINMIYY